MSYVDQIGNIITDALDPALSREEVIDKLKEIDDLVMMRMMMKAPTMPSAGSCGKTCDPAARGSRIPLDDPLLVFGRSGIARIPRSRKSTML